MELPLKEVIQVVLNELLEKTKLQRDLAAVTKERDELKGRLQKASNPGEGVFLKVR